MENLRIVKKILWAGAMIFIVPVFVYGYADQTTHPALTDEAIDLFNNYYPSLKISNSDKELIKRGSIEEDMMPRWINHFYDPVYNRGLFDAPSSKIWAQSPEIQAKSTEQQLGNMYFKDKMDFSLDFSWQRAIYDYCYRDKNRAMIALGHVLHLAQDATVPDHTRNDSHGTGSPFEAWASQFNPDNFHLSEELIKNSQSPVLRGGLDEYFDFLANYSNNNFFSRDSIRSDYARPMVDKQVTIIYSGVPVIFGLSSIGGDEYKLVRIKEYYDLVGKRVIYVYSLEDSDNLIFQDYWRLLSKQAVINSAGVIKLFFDEVEKEKQTGKLKNENFSTSDSVLNKVGNVLIGFKNSIFSWLTPDSAPSPTPYPLFVSTQALPELDSGANHGVSSPTPAPQFVFSPTAGSTPYPTPYQNPYNLPPAVIGVWTGPTPTPTPLPSSRPSWFSLSGASLAFGLPEGMPAGFGGGAPPTNTSTYDVQVIQNAGRMDTTPPPAEEAGQAEPTPELTPSPESTPTLEITPIPDPTPEITPPPDTTPPEVFFEINECENSLSSEACLLLTQAVSIKWGSATDDAIEYELKINDSAYSTTSTSTSAVLENDSENFISLKARDEAGNWSEYVAKTVYINSRPVVINEIAWGGTSADANDEWIELFNRSQKIIDLNGWIIEAGDGSPLIELSGVIAGRGYYLIERTDDTVISDINADLTAPFSGDGGSGLNNGGEILKLVKVISGGENGEDIIIDETPAGFGWCAGNSWGISMERYSTDDDGKNAENWLGNNQIISNGRNKNGDLVFGTPKQRNSANYLINRGFSIQNNLTLDKKHSPYLVNNITQEVRAGAVLTIEPGVVIKFYNDAGILANGKIISLGTEAEPVVFTSFYDDESSGDISGSGDAAPSAGIWLGLQVVGAGADGSRIEHTIMRYGGKYYSGMGNPAANLYVSDADILINNSVFEYSRVYGLRLNESDSEIENCVFRENKGGEYTSGAGLYAQAGKPKLRNSRFEGNLNGLRLENSDGVFEGNIFENNLLESIYSLETAGEFKNNSGKNNGYNCIKLFGTLVKNGVEKTLYPNELPYCMDNANIPAGAVLNIEKGVVAKKDKTILVYGSLVLKGENFSDIIFTHLSDDNYGGDTDNNGTQWVPRDGVANMIAVFSGGKFDGEGFTLKYGGGAVFGQESYGAITGYGGEIKISNAVIENSYPHGVRLEGGSVAEISNTVIKNHTAWEAWGRKAALSLVGSTANLSSVAFENNLIDYEADGTSVLNIAP